MPFVREQKQHGSVTLCLVGVDAVADDLRLKLVFSAAALSILCKIVKSTLWN